jgi:NAD(P)-dependent dehydrogenase (short-subunit alcohol dehydrogenase family)
LRSRKAPLDGRGEIPFPRYQSQNTDEPELRLRALLGDNGTREMTRATAERLGVTVEDFSALLVKEIPVGRSGNPEDVAFAILFFASEGASFASGQVLYLAGGPLA